MSLEDDTKKLLEEGGISADIRRRTKEYFEHLEAQDLSEEAINQKIKEYVERENARYHEEMNEREKQMMSPTFATTISAGVDGQSQMKKSDVWTLPNVHSKEYGDLLNSYSIKREDFHKHITDQVHRMSGKGGFYNQFQNTLTRIDKYGHRIMSSTAELSGLTFITRPKLNLSTATLKQDPQLIMLNTDNPNSIAFMMRMLLDTKLCKSDAFSELVERSPLIDKRSPWLTPLMNNLTDISGFPDPTMDVFTSEGGFFNEDISFAAGSDRCRRTFELQMTFNDVQYGVIMAMMQFWFEWIGLLNQGVVAPYMEDMEQRRLPYTVSIYRFMFDPSRRYITRWCKCTGCFPRAVPVGGVFNISQGEVFSNSAAKFTVPFTCNIFEYNKATIIHDFNILSERYCPQITTDAYQTAALEPQSNFIGLPYIISTKNGMQMVWRFKKEDNQNLHSSVFAGYVTELSEMSARLNMMETSEQQIQVGPLDAYKYAPTSHDNGGVYTT
jgi:hypothetical protein